jgi:hypothetical protein
MTTRKRAMSRPVDGLVRHGVGQCHKVHHDDTGGYLHGANDDRPYDVDGATYCGRCHRWMPNSEGESRAASARTLHPLVRHSDSGGEA